MTLPAELATLSPEPKWTDPLAKAPVEPELTKMSPLSETEAEEVVISTADIPVIATAASALLPEAIDIDPPTTPEPATRSIEPAAALSLEPAVNAMPPTEPLELPVDSKIPPLEA
jgi:hypothetical protein